MTPPVVLCIERESYLCAIVALERTAKAMGVCSTSVKILNALADFERAHAMYLAVDARITTPALLRRQI